MTDSADEAGLLMAGIDPAELVTACRVLAGFVTEEAEPAGSVTLVLVLKPLTTVGLAATPGWRAAASAAAA